MRPRPLHVAMIIQVYLPHIGGAERQVAALAPLLRERNVHVSVITRQLRGYKIFEEIDGVPVYRTPAPPNKVLASLLYSGLSVPLLMRLQPDILHAHELLSPTTTAVLAKPFVRAPVVAKLLRGGTLGDIAKLKKKASGQKRLENFRKNVDVFISISDEISRELREIGVGDDKQVFIPNGVDAQKFHPLSLGEKRALRGKLGLDPDSTYVIFSGRLDPEKRIDLLVDVWDSIRQQFATAHLLLVGAGHLSSTLQSLPEKGIHMVGSVENVNEYLQAADIFVLPSMTEGLSNSLLEAMSTGLASVATNVGGTPDVISHMHSGYMIEAGSKEQLSQALMTLLSDEAMRERLGAEARRFVQEKYALTATAEKLRILYDRLASSGKTTS